MKLYQIIYVKTTIFAMGMEIVTRKHINVIV